MVKGENYNSLDPRPGCHSHWTCSTHMHTITKESSYTMYKCTYIES